MGFKCKRGMEGELSSPFLSTCSNTKPPKEEGGGGVPMNHGSEPCDLTLEAIVT